MTATLLGGTNLSDYDQDDYLLREDVLRQFSVLMATPHILAETSNLLAQTSEPDRGDLLASFGAFLQDLSVFQELVHPSRFAVEISEFVRLGLTDAALLVEQGIDFTLVTADRRLFGACGPTGRKALYFPSLKDE